MGWGALGVLEGSWGYWGSLGVLGVLGGLAHEDRG